MNTSGKTRFSGSILGKFSTVGPPRVVMGIVGIAGVVAIALRDPDVAKTALDILGGIIVVAILWPVTKSAQVKHKPRARRPAHAVGGK